MMSNPQCVPALDGKIVVITAARDPFTLGDAREHLCTRCCQLVDHATRLLVRTRAD
jgi:hypothetical protein